jgi:DNA repair protein RecN (Recombination protein N)
MKTATRHLQDLARFETAAAELWPRLESLRSEVEDIAEQVRAWTDESEASPERMAQVEERMLLLDRLKRKYGPTLDDVLQYHADLARKLDTVERSELYLNEAAQATEAAAKTYRELAEQLTEMRHAAAERLSRAIEKEVADLAMKLRFSVAIESNQNESAWTATGWDRIGFLASTNPGEPLKPLEEIASGGELSRVLLALQVVIEQAVNPKRRATASPGRTLVFDEIDAGIGGRAAEAVGRKMQQLAGRYQLLCVTHLAQIATCGQHHLRVDKVEQGGRTLTRISALNGADRVEEIARMLAGDTINETALQHARELLEARAGGKG